MAEKKHHSTLLSGGLQQPAPPVLLHANSWHRTLLYHFIDKVTTNSYILRRGGSAVRVYAHISQLVHGRAVGRVVWTLKRQGHNTQRGTVLKGKRAGTGALLAQLGLESAPGGFPVWTK